MRQGRDPSRSRGSWRPGFCAALAAALLVLLAVAADAPSAGHGGWMPAGPSHEVTVWAVGDGADADGDGRRVARMLERRRLQLFLYLGDVYEYGTARDFAHSYAPIFGPLARRTAPTPGNHEWPNRKVGYWPYWKRVRGARPPNYYAFSIGGWQLLSLNSEADHRPGSPQLRWLRRKVSLTPGFGTCRLAYWHRPRFSDAGHPNQPDVAPLWDALRGKASLVVNGHSHNYQRFRPRHGLVEVIAGTGGRPVYGEPAARKDPMLAAAHFKHGALRLSLRKGSADLAFVEVGGKVLDRDGLSCRLGDARPAGTIGT